MLLSVCNIHVCYSRQPFHVNDGHRLRERNDKNVGTATRYDQMALKIELPFFNCTATESIVLQHDSYSFIHHY